MAQTHIGTFRCVLYTPRAKLLDCRLRSLILPAVDGQIGILRNHIPMLCKLGLGIMQARDIVSGEKGETIDDFFLIDGGFARISENFVTVLAYDVTAFSGHKMEEVDNIIEKAEKLIQGDRYALQHRLHDIQKASLVLHLAEMAGIKTKTLPQPAQTV